MTDKKKAPYWMAVDESKPVCFADLPHMMAKAMHPGDNEGMAYAAAHIKLKNELPQAVRDGLLRVRNPAGLGLHTFPHGDALKRAVLIPDTDLAPFLNERGIELRLTPHGSGPDYWTMENAAAAMQEQLNWHDGTRAEFQDQLQAGAQAGGLVIREPRTCLPIDSPNARTYWELVTPADVNAWLESLGAPYRWSPAPNTTAPATASAQSESTGPLPLTTGDIAFCFADLHWSEKEWKKPLGYPPKWLKVCVHTPGQRGKSPALWNPVPIGAALVRDGYAKANSIRGRFQSNHLLTPWLEQWKTYEADYIATE